VLQQIAVETAPTENQPLPVGASLVAICFGYLVPRKRGKLYLCPIPDIFTGSVEKPKILKSSRELTDKFCSYVIQGCYQVAEINIKYDGS